MAKDAKPKSDPIYAVVRVKGPDDFTVIDPARSAKTQDAAMDAVWDDFTPEEQGKKTTLGAFLAGSYRENEYEAETKVIPKKKQGRRSLTEKQHTPPPAAGEQASM